MSFAAYARRTGKEVALFPGMLPEDPGPLIKGTSVAPAVWDEGSGFARPELAPPKWSASSEGPPHIRLDRAIDFLIGDRLE